MPDQTGDEILDEASEIVESETDPPMSLSAFIEEVMDQPELACSAPEYLLRAIEHFGTRTITEHGEEIERYRFFDDPANDGEHAILGNTELLNDFVNALRRMARGPSNKAKMFWFEGPTSTGKSELKRCLINGLREFSKTEEGKRFTLEWNLTGNKEYSGSGMTYGDDNVDHERNWYRSPVQTNPLSVLPEDLRREILYGEDAESNLWVPPDLDPFCQEAYDVLDERYDGDFQDIVDDQHLQVSRYTVDIGNGIGVLQSEDQGRVPQKMVGEWMSGMLKKLDSRGRRNPQAMSYDGVISQGNAGVTIIEDAAHHFETLARMLSVPEGDEVKIDMRNVLPVDTTLIIISNPDMEAELMKSTQQGAADSFRPLRRRLDLYRLLYLVTPSIEAELLHRLLVGYDTVWGDKEDRIGESIVDDGIEIAPHAVEAMAYMNVVSRIETPDGLTRMEKARIYNGETIERGVTETSYEDLEQDGRSKDEGHDGIPCTFTQEVIDATMANARSNDETVILPQDLLEELPKSMAESPIFTSAEVRSYTDESDNVSKYILEQQGHDVLDAMLREHTVGEEEVEEYVEHVYCWGTDEDSVEPDPIKMKVFETDHLGRFDESHYDLRSSDTPGAVSKNVKEFREDIISGISTYLYEHRDDNYTVDAEDVPLSEFPDLQELVEENDWDDVEREFENLDPTRWEDPVDGTQTEKVKELTIDNMVDMFTYSEESARRTSETVFKEAVDRGIFDGRDIGPGGEN